MESQKYITPPASTPASSSIVLHSLPTVLFYRPQFSAGLIHRLRQSQNPGKAYILLWPSSRTYYSFRTPSSSSTRSLAELLTRQQKLLFCRTLNAGVSQSHWSVYEYISTALSLIIQRTPRKPSNTPASLCAQLTGGFRHIMTIHSAWRHRSPRVSWPACTVDCFQLCSHHNFLKL
jgi:hypothetical protein